MVLTWNELFPPIFINKAIYHWDMRDISPSAIDHARHLSTATQEFVSVFVTWCVGHYSLCRAFYQCAYFISVTIQSPINILDGQDTLQKGLTWPSDTILHRRFWWTLPCCLTAPSHYRNRCWLIISKVEWQSLEGISQEIPQPSIIKLAWMLLFWTYIKS